MLVINDAYLAMHTMQELNRRDCAGKVRLKLGKAITDSERFKRVFKRYSRGTFYEDVSLEIEEVPVELSCGCGYSRNVGGRSYVHREECPRCGSPLTVSKGDEFEIVEPSDSLNS